MGAADQIRFYAYRVFFFLVAYAPFFERSESTACDAHARRAPERARQCLPIIVEYEYQYPTAEYCPVCSRKLVRHQVWRERDVRDRAPRRRTASCVPLRRGPPFAPRPVPGTRPSSRVALPSAPSVRAARAPALRAQRAPCTSRCRSTRSRAGERAAAQACNGRPATCNMRHRCYKTEHEMQRAAAAMPTYVPICSSTRVKQHTTQPAHVAAIVAALLSPVPCCMHAALSLLHC
jgi:hypothetical protein